MPLIEQFSNHRLAAMMFSYSLGFSSKVIVYWCFPPNGVLSSSTLCCSLHSRQKKKLFLPLGNFVCLSGSQKLIDSKILHQG